MINLLGIMNMTEAFLGDTVCLKGDDLMLVVVGKVRVSSEGHEYCVSNELIRLKDKLSVDPATHGGKYECCICFSE